MPADRGFFSELWFSLTSLFRRRRERDTPTNARPPSFRPQVRQLEDRTHPGEAVGSMLCLGLPGLGLAFPANEALPAIPDEEICADVRILQTEILTPPVAPAPEVPRQTETESTKQATAESPEMPAPATDSALWADPLASPFQDPLADDVDAAGGLGHPHLPATEGNPPGGASADGGGGGGGGASGAAGGGGAAHGGGGAGSDNGTASAGSAGGHAGPNVPPSTTSASPSGNAAAAAGPAGIGASVSSGSPPVAPVGSAASERAPASSSPAPAATAAQQAAAQAWGQLALHFEANQGQTDPQAAFLAHGSGYTLYLTQQGQAVFDLHQEQAGASAAVVTGDVVRVSLVGASSAPQAVGLNELPGKSNYFLGTDPSQWHTGIANYGSVQYQGIYPGIDLTYAANAAGQLEYSFTIHPGADPSQIRLAIAGVQVINRDGQGGLVLHTAAGDLYQQAPQLYQMIGGVRQAVAGGFTLDNAGQVGFQVGAYDPSLPLVIDPALAYSTFLGGSSNDQANGIAVDSSGNAYLVGSTGYTGFPVTTGAYQTTPGGSQDAFVVKLNAAGTAEVYATYLGGSGFDNGAAIAVDSAGDAIVVGDTSSTNTPTGPTQVYREDRGNGYTETLTMSATPHVTNGQPDGSEAISNVQSLSRSYVNAAGQVAYTDDYFNLAGLTYATTPNLGTENTNFYRTRYGYDSRGNNDRVQAPTGTITRTVFDGLGRAVSSWVGTNDTPTSGQWSPTNNTGTANMVQVEGFVYDGGGVGDGNLTQDTLYPGGSAAARVTQSFYDWRDRLVATKDGVQATEDTTTHRPITYLVLDNLGEVTTTQQYDGDQVSIVDANGDGVPDAPSASLLRAQQTTAYDEQGRVYQDKTYSVDQTNGTVSTNALTTNIWYDHRGNVIKVASPGGLVDKTQYDGAGRPVKEFTTDGGGDSTWADAGNVTGDNVLEQTETTYDANGNPILTVTRQRNHDETATGSLGDPNNAPKARVYYSAAYYDAADRPTAQVDVGTNGGTAYTRPSTPPSASDTTLVTTLSYNAAGWLDTTTDPRGIQEKEYYDALGNVTKDIQDYTDGTPTSNTNKTTETTYDGDGNVLTVKADEPGGSSQTTQYVYGVTTAGGSAVNSNDIVAAVEHPDPTTGQPSTAQQDTDTVNALGETTTFTDRNGNVHQISYDVLGRPVRDAVTTLGTGVDGSVRRIETAYDTGGRAYLFTSYDAATGGNIVNQVQRSFNGLGQLTTEYQSHSGAVNTSTTPSVQYGYTQMAGGVNNSRQTSLTYPNGRTVNYNYASGLDDAISRLTSISDNSGTLEQETYLGLSTVVQRSYPQPGIALTYIKQSGEPNGDAGDQYTGLDRFGRVVDQRWLQTGSGTATDRFQYGYDRDGNALYRNNLVNTAFGELYHASGAGQGYDNLNEIQAFARGVLSASQQGGPLDTVASPSHTQSYTPDALGNFSNVTTDGTPQSRSSNQQNEVTQVGSATLTFDANGNLTTDETGKQLVYDAWNRLVQVKASGGSTLASYQYDALGRRVVETVSGTATDVYFSAGWQVLEERVGGQARVQYVWSPVGVDTLVERDRDPSGSGTLSERLYVQQDANGNVTALVNTSGQVVERYVYDPFGAVTVLSASWSVLSGSQYASRYLFQAGRYEWATGYLNERERELLPTIMRWAQPDPIWFGGGDPNVYRFVADNPANFKDPSGLFGGSGRQMDRVIDTGPLQGLPALSPAELGAAMGGATGSMMGRFGAAPPARNWLWPLEAGADWSDWRITEAIGDILEGGPAERRQEIGLDGSPQSVGTIPLPPRSDTEAISNSWDVASQNVQEWRDERRRLREEAPVQTLVGEAVASCLPGLGHLLALEIVTDSEAPWWQRGLALLSLGASVRTAEVLPNYGATVRNTEHAVGAARNEARMVGNAARTEAQAAASFAAPVRSFSSFDALKRALGLAGEGQVWHHIVEQRAANVTRFGAEAIHNTSNVVRLSRDANQAIANYYSRIRPFTNGQTVRQWLGTQSFAQQDAFGRRIMDLVLSGATLP
jgi:RHS repeat-associated protein